MASVSGAKFHKSDFPLQMFAFARKSSPRGAGHNLGGNRPKRRYIKVIHNFHRVFHTVMSTPL